MRTSLSCLKLCLLFCAFAQGVGHTRAVQSALMRPPDAASTVHGEMDDKRQPTPSETPFDFTTQHARETVNEDHAPLQSDTSGRETAKGFECALSRDARDRYTSEDGKTWLVSSAVLKEIDNDLQKVVDCTKDGDIISFNVTDVVRPSSRVIIPRQLTLATQVDSTDSNDGFFSNSTTKTRFTCPHKNSGLFFVESTNVTFVDLIIERCVFDGTYEAQSLIEVAACRTEDTPGLVALRRLEFRQNDLTAASALRISSPSCSELKMVEVEISDNICSGEACGVHLAQKNRLDNCTCYGNRVTDADEQHSSLFYGHISSSTKLRGFAASGNKLTIIRILESDISLSNASFRRNVLGTRIDEETKHHCVHSTKSSVKVEKCTFVANEGFTGPVILAEESKISVFRSEFSDNVASDEGGCVYAEGSELEFKHTIALNNTAHGRGGFLGAENSKVMLEHTNANGNIAKKSGGFMYADGSTVDLDETDTANNTADWGGFISAFDSNMKLVNSNATANRASYGGFLNAKNSNVTLIGTNANANSAVQTGGFLYADTSSVKLVNTKATANRASNGGFLDAEDSNVTLIGTNANANSAVQTGGFLYAETSSVKLVNSNATANRALYGGFLRAGNSNVTLIGTNANGNNAKEGGGFMYADGSTVNLDETDAANNTAKFGGFISAFDSNMKLVHTNATANRASYGAFLNAKNSNVTLIGTNANGNNAKEGGGFMYADGSTVNLDETDAANNTAQFGGFICASDSNMRLKRTNANLNSAVTSGGFLYAETSSVKLVNSNATANRASYGGFLRAENSYVTLEHINANLNRARKYGGFLYADTSSVKLVNSNATANRASYGGFLNAKNSNVTLIGTNANANSAVQTGGFLYADTSSVKLVNTKATANRASNGGFLDAELSNVTLITINANGNKASKDGGFLYADVSRIKLKWTNARNSSSVRSGGFLYAENSTVSITQSYFSLSSAGATGGFASASGNSSIIVNDASIVQGRSMNGGAIWLDGSHLKGINLSITHCEAEVDGGGVLGLESSSLLCSNCVFRNNSAKGGNGGAVNLDAEFEQSLALQFVRSRFENNAAELGGGLFFVCSEKKKECLENSTDCPTVALIETQFHDNEARVGGGAVFAGYKEAIRFRCNDASPDSDLSLYAEKEWRALSYLESVDDICSSWKANTAVSYGHDVATYAATAELTIENANKSVCVSGGESCVIEGYRSGTELPSARVELLDDLRQGPASSYLPVAANMSSLSGQFFTSPVVIPMELWTCTFRSITSFVPPGEYKLTVEFGEGEIENVDVTVRVRSCIIGEKNSTRGICVDCGTTEYNFHAQAYVCLPCPENGNCEFRVITPNEGYWHRTPCSDQLHRCLPASACEFEDRSENLKAMVKEVSSCDFDREWIEVYAQAQCAEGHTGPLCGSCEEDFGSGLSSKCNKCLKGFYNVAYIMTSAIILLVMTIITIHGTLGALRGTAEQTRGRSIPSSSAEESEPSLPRTEVQAVGLPASEKTLAKWKAVEMFKITLSYVQTTVLLASLDVGWAIPVVVMATIGELLGGLASDGIRRSVVCLSSKDLSLQPTALALVVNVCIVPCTVFLCWIVFWAAKSARQESDGLPRYLSKRCLLTAMVIWYITLVPVLKTALSVFLCVDVHDSADFTKVDVMRVYWAVDTGMQCYEDDHRKLIYGVVVAFVCPVYGGLLALFIYYLKSPFQHLIYKRGWAYQTTGFLYRSYRMDLRVYWELVIVARKVTISFLVFCAHLFDSGVPITGVAYIIMLAILAQILAMPYREDFKDLNGMELASLFVSVATTLAASMLKDESYPENVTRVLLTVACALLNVILFLVFVFYILKFAAKFLRHEMSEQDERFASDVSMFCVLMHWIGYKVKHLIGKLCSPTSEEPEISDPLDVDA